MTSYPVTSFFNYWALANLLNSCDDFMRKTRILDLHGPLGQDRVDELVEVIVGVELIELVDLGHSEEELLEHLLRDVMLAGVDVVEQEPHGMVDNSLFTRILLQSSEYILCRSTFHHEEKSTSVYVGGQVGSI